MARSPANIGNNAQKYKNFNYDETMTMKNLRQSNQIVDSNTCDYNIDNIASKRIKTNGDPTQQPRYIIMHGS